MIELAHDDVDMLLALLAFDEGNLPVIVGQQCRPLIWTVELWLFSSSWRPCDVSVM